MVSRPVKSESPNTIVVAGGGTGGHLYPGLAVAEALGERLDNPHVVFVGTNRAIDRHVLGQISSDWVSQALPRLSPLPWRWPTMIRRYRQSASIVARFFDAHPPAAVIGTGGFGSVPAVRQAWRRGIPTFLLNPDALPGRANRFLARNVKFVFASWPGLEKHLPSKTAVRVHGCPVRADFLQVNRTPTGRLAALGRFGLDPDLKTLLITGASQGARSINGGVVACLPALLAIDGWQLLHLTGHQDHDRIRQAYAGVAYRGAVLSYTDHMAEAITAADLVVSRAGASTLAEITAVGRASVLMPYPYHRDMHQLANARCLARESAATIVPDGIDSSVNAPRLAEALTALMKNDQLREAMAAAAGRIGRPCAAARIAEDIIGVAFARGEGDAIPETLEVSREHARYV